MSETQSIKIGMFGGGGVGKTCITLRFLKDEFTEGYIPTIEDFFSKTIEVDNQTVSLTIIDTAGQDDFAEMRPRYYSDVQAFVFVIDISNKQSVDELRDIFEDAKENATGDVIGVIAANKADLRDEGGNDLIPKEDFKKYESEFGCKVFETSAKTNLNITELFKYVIHSYLEKDKPKAKTTEKKTSSSKKSDESGGGGGCCQIA